MNDLDVRSITRQTRFAAFVSAIVPSLSAYPRGCTTVGIFRISPRFAAERLYDSRRADVGCDLHGNLDLRSTPLYKVATLVSH